MMKSHFKQKVAGSVGVVSVLFAAPAFAVCPLCVIAVGAGIGFSHWLGIDDTVTGLWVGGFVVACIAWTIHILNAKNIRFKFRVIITTILYYLCFVVPLYPMGIMGHPLNKLWGIDKLLLGIVIGSVVFFVAMVSYFAMKKHNNGHAYFPFQKVVMPIAPLLILSILFYFITLPR